MALKPDSPYNPVPSVAPETQQPSDYNRTEATPADFGSQVGGALQQAGQTGQKLGDEATDVALQQQGMINQSLAQNAETEYTTKLNGIVDGYKSLEGLDAVAAKPQITAQIAQLRQQQIASIPTAGAQRSFAELAQRHEAFALSDVGSYYTQQIKTGAVNSSHAMVTNAVNQASSLSVAQDDGRFNYSLNSAKYGLNDMMKTQGYGSVMTVDPKTGDASFDTSTPQGVSAQAVYQSKRDEVVGAAWQNRIKALADDPSQGNVGLAQQIFTRDRDQIPAEAQSQIAAYLQPKVRALSASQTAGGTLQNLDAGYRESLVPSGPVTTKITSYAQQAGVSNSLALTSANIESGIGAVADRPGSQFKGVYQMGDSAWAARGGTAANRGDLNAQVALGIDNLKHSQDVATTALGQKPQDWQTYLVHQQGDAGGAALLKADPNSSAASALAPAYNGDVIQASKAITANGGNANMTAGQFLQHWQQTYAAKTVGGGVADAAPVVPGAPSGLQPPQTKADYYRAHYADAVTQARADATAAHPDDPVAADLAVSRVQQQMDATIKQQSESYKADNDTVFQAMNGDLSKGTHPVTVDQLRAVSPEAAQAWDRLQAQQPQVAHEIATRLISENAKADGSDAKTYGAGFGSVFQRIHAADNDPQKITDPTQLYSMVGTPGGLTMSGLEKARAEIAGKNTPDGEAEGTMRKTLFATAKQTLTGTNDVMGIKDPKGEELYLKWMAGAYKQIDAAKAAGKTPQQLYTPGSPDYIGNSIDGMKRTLAQKTADMMSATSEDVPATPAPSTQGAVGKFFSGFGKQDEPDLTTPAGIKAAVTSGKLSRQDAIKRLTGMSLAPASSAPLPMAQADTGRGG